MPATNLFTTPGLTYVLPSSLSQGSGIISATVAGFTLTVAVPSLTAGTMYYVYLLNGALQVSSSVSSTFRGSNSGALLVGAFLADSSGAFGSFVTIVGLPRTETTLLFQGTAGGGLGTLTGANFYYNRDGKNITCDYRFTTGTVSSAIALLPLPTNILVDSTLIPSGTLFLGTCLNNSNVGETRLVALPGQTTSNLYFNTANTLNGTPMNGNASPFATGQIESGQYRVPIAAWSNTPLIDL